MQRKIKNKGFSLIEILVSIVVLGVLSGIGYPVYQDYVVKGQIGQLAPLLAESRLDVENHAMLSGQFTLNKIKSEFDPKLLASQTIKDGVITFTFKDGIGSRLSGKKYSFTPTYEDKNISWSCETDVNTKLDPFHCKSLISGGGDINGGDVIDSSEDGRVKVIRNHAGGETVTCAGMTPGESFDYNGVNYSVMSDWNNVRNHIRNTGITDNENICTTHLVDMNLLFEGMDSFNYDISNWDTSNITSMVSMFSNAKSFNQDISGWDTSNVINMNNMFQGAFAFNQDIGGWNVNSVNNMSGILDNARAFNQDISSWNTKNVTNMQNMFNNAESFNQDISGWDTSNVVNMNNMFQGAKLFNQDLSSWCVEKIYAKPNGFDVNALLYQNNRPVWGTCPSK